MKKTEGILTHKRIACMLMIMLVATVACVPAFAAVTNGVVRNPNGGSNVNVREWGSFDAPILSTVRVGTKVDIARTDGAWYCVWVNGIAGYIHSSLVSTGGAQTADTGVTATVSISPLNMRETPSMHARVITQLYSGATVSVLSRGDTWTQIRVGDACGYVLTSSLQFGTGTSAPKPPATTSNANATVKTSNGGNLNLRTWTSESADVIDSYGNGTRVRVLTHGAAWCKVQVGNQVGYMVTKFLKFDGSASAGKVASQSYNAVVSNPNSSSVLNLRKEPSANSKSLGQYPNGTKVKVVGVGTEWYRVQINGVEGYMMAKYVKLTNSSATPNKTVSNNGSFVNLRSGAGYDFSVLKRVDNGEAATVVVPHPIWSKVIVKDGANYLTGYMLNSFLK